MSIATEIERLNTSKISIVQAIRSKGVEVPEDAKIDTLANYVAMIGSTEGYPFTFTGNPIVATETILGQPFAGFKIFGKSTQDGVPSSENLVPIVSAGDGGSIELTITGGNICPVASGTTNFYINALVKSGHEYTICAKVEAIAGNTSGNINFNLMIRDIESSEVLETITVQTWKDKTWLDGYLSFTPQASGKIYINSPSPLNWSEIAVYPFVLTSREYDEYQSTLLTLPTPNGLPGVPVDSKGNCTDTIGQQYTSDYWDFGDGLQHILCGKIESYNGEEITTPYISSTGDLTIGARVIYVLPEPQTQTIPAETIVYYGKLTSYGNKTVISTAEPVATMEAKLYCDIANTIDRKVNEGIAAAVKLSGGNL